MIMKQIKIWKNAILILTTMSIMMACGGDSDDDNGGQVVPPPSNTKRLIKVTTNNWTDDYTYDNQGRVTKIQRNGRDFSTFSYDNNTIIETIYDIATWQNKYTLENGRISKEYDGNTKTTTSFVYQNGYLITEKEESGRDIQYNWNDGNLMTIGVLETFEYTNYACPQGFFHFGRNANICHIWGMSGYIGKTMRNLPSKHTEGNLFLTFNWTIKDGLPVKMISTRENGITSTYTFEWE